MGRKKQMSDCRVGRDGGTSLRLQSTICFLVVSLSLWVARSEEDMPLFKDKWFVDEAHLKDLRSRFAKDVDADPYDYHEEDIKRVNENDWYLARYILHTEADLEKSLAMLKDSLRFRKDLEVNTIRKKDLPKNYFDVRAVILCNKDHRDHPVIAIRGKTHIRRADTIRFQQQYFLYWIEKGVRASDWGAVSILFDCSDAGVSNVDLEMIRFLFDVFKKYCPWGLGYFLVYNMPWYLSAVWKIIKTWIPQKHASKIVFVDSKSIKEYILPDQLPKSLGGTSSKLYEPRNGIVKDGDESD